MNAEQGRRRVHREARNHQHQRPGQARAGRGPRQGQPAAPAANEPEINPDPEPIVPDLEPMRFVQHARTGLCWDGTNLGIKPVELMFEWQPAHPIRGNNPYWDDPTKKHTGMCADQPIQTLIVESYIYDSEVVPQSTFDVFMPALTLLSKEYSIGERGLDLVVKSGVALLVKRFPLVYDSHPALLSMTVEFYAARGSHTARQSKNGLMTIATHNGKELLDTRYESVNINEALIDRDIVGVRRVEAIDCDLEHDWLHRTDFEATMTGAWYQDEGGYYRLPDSAGKGHFDTVYFTLRGDRVFNTYDNSPINLTLGLKRILGARPSEASYRVHSYHALRAVGDALHRDLQALREGKLSIGRSVRKAFAALRHYDLLEPQLLITGDVDAMYKHLGQSTAAFLQDVNYTTIRRMLDVTLTAGRWSYYSLACSALETLPTWDLRHRCGAIAHAKRALREQYVNGVVVHESSDLMVRRLEAKVKRELGKPPQQINGEVVAGKVPRLYVGYGAGCMTANELPEMMKKCYCRDYITYVNGVTITISILGKPTTNALTDCFRNVLSATHTPNTIRWCIFSDDQIVGGMVNDNSFLVNADISSNDSSQSFYAFGVLDAMGMQLDPLTGGNLGAQCTLPVVVTNPDNVLDRLELKFKVQLEGSGTTGTKVLNDSGSYGIAACATWLLATNGVASVADVELAIRDGGLAVGHVLTTEWCGSLNSVVPSKCQFLKHSPEATDQGWVAVQNLGPLLRSLGRVSQIMTPKQLGVSASEFRGMSDDQRCDRYFGAVIAGHVHDLPNPLIQALRRRFPAPAGTVPIYVGNNHNVVEATASSATLAPHSFCERYDTDPEELAALAYRLETLVCGQVVHDDLLTKIYKVDYGL